MLIADYTDANGVRKCQLFEDFEHFHRETFSPDCNVNTVVELAPRGTSYRERKETGCTDPRHGSRTAHL